MASGPSLTEPAELARWRGPHGFTTPEIALDLSVGGDYRFAMQSLDGDLFHLSGEFLEIAPPSRLVYTFRWDEARPSESSDHRPRAPAASTLRSAPVRTSASRVVRWSANSRCTAAT